MSEIRKKQANNFVEIIKEQNSLELEIKAILEFTDDDELRTKEEVEKIFNEMTEDKELDIVLFNIILKMNNERFNYYKTLFID